MSSNAPSDRTRVKRVPKRGAYDRDTINAILDEGLVAHVGVIADGHPIVIPTAYARDGDRLLIHGSRASRLMRALEVGVEACFTVTLLDGLVMARSAFHHSMNYRSVMLFGKGRAMVEREEKMEALRRFVDGLVPGRWDEAREPNEVEMKQTAAVEFPIDEASAKVRSGPVVDEEEDYDLRVWAGILPLTLTPGEPEADDRLVDGVDLPDHLAQWAPWKR